MRLNTTHLPSFDNIRVQYTNEFKYTKEAVRSRLSFVGSVLVYQTKNSGSYSSSSIKTKYEKKYLPFSSQQISGKNRVNKPAKKKAALVLSAVFWLIRRKTRVHIPGQASKLNMKKIFLLRFPLSRYLAKAVRVNKNCHEKVSHKYVVGSQR